MKFAVALSFLSQALGAMSPSTTQDSYLTTHLTGVGFTSILTVDDGVLIPKTGATNGETTQLAGTPDGLAYVDGSDMIPAEPDFFYILANHELSATTGGVRDHGGQGAFVSKWKVNKASLEVVEGDDLVKQFMGWNWETEMWELQTTNFNRICSGDRPSPTALYNSATGLGTQEIIYFTGEESSGGRVLAHVVTGPDAGTSFELAHFGYTAIENVVFNPLEQDLSIAVISDDSSDGELYVYVGTKQADGNDVQKAGLVGGNLYAVAIEGKPHELDDILDLRVMDGDRFALKPIGMPGNRPINGTETTDRSIDDAGIYFPDSEISYAALGLPGPEDSAWDFREGRENNLYFVTKGGYFAASKTNGLNAPSRLYRLEFDDTTDPTLGGTLHIEYEALRSYDNIAVEIVNDQAKVYIQEDLGGETALSQILEYDIATGSMSEIAAFDPEIFYKGGSKFLTSNEESAGIISLKDVLGDGYFATSIQVHTNAGLSDPDFLVEHGQIVIFQIDSDREADAFHREIISPGDLWNYRVDGVDPGTEWSSPGFALDDAWNVDIFGNVTGSAPTPIGYGEAEGILRTNVGQPPVPRPAAYYFRKEFDLENPDDVVRMELLLLVDDGCTVHLNGVEIARYNMDYDVEITHETFATAGESAEKDWKQIRVTNAGEYDLLATGNVLAVSMHQDEDSSSDIRFDCRLTMIEKSPSDGVAPATPVARNATALSFNEVELSWEPQEGVKMFQLERQQQGDVAWEVVDHHLPGSFSAILDTDVIGEATYNYRLVGYNIHGRSSYSQAMSVFVPANPLPQVFKEDFEEADSFGQFTVVDVAEPEAGFTWINFDGTGAVQGNGFGAESPTEDWLILTNPLNFAYFAESQLIFDAQQSFSGPLPEILFSSNYDAMVHTNPNDANWTLIVADDSEEGALVPQGPFDLTSIATEKGVIAWKYTSLGGNGGQSTRYRIDDIEIKAECGFDFEGGENSDIEGTLETWTVVNRNSAFGWIYDTYQERQGAINNNFGSTAGGELGGTASEDWLIGPEFVVSDTNFVISFDYYERFGDTIEKPLAVLITDDFTGDVTTTTWTDVTPENLNGSTDDVWIPVKTTPLPVQGNTMRLAFLYTSTGTSGGSTKRIGVDHVCVEQESGPFEGSFAYSQAGGELVVTADLSGGSFPYECSIDFGDDVAAERSGNDCSPTKTYSSPGEYVVTAVATDAVGATVETSFFITVTKFELPSKQEGRVRIAAFNTAFSEIPGGAGSLAELMKTSDHPAIQASAEVLQVANADIVGLNEFDHVYTADGEFDYAATMESLVNFKKNYLEKSQNGKEPVTYDYVYVAPCNTGVPSGLDLNNDGQVQGGNDAFGFGNFAGQFSLAMLSKYPIVEDKVRTFQKFLWKDMPDAFLPPDPQDSDNNGDASSYYTAEELDVFRLSSKSHWDVPVDIDGEVIHVLQSHPTPPVFDDGEATSYPDAAVVDWNGLRNHDEIRFWADYVASKEYIYDDAGVTGGLVADGAEDAKFVIVGDQNADPIDGDSSFNPILLLLNHDKINSEVVPTSAGALEQVPVEGFAERETKTSSFNLRVDYVLPSKQGFEPEQAAVVWPLRTDLEFNLLDASDHRLVLLDAKLKTKEVDVGDFGEELDGGDDGEDDGDEVDGGDDGDGEGPDDESGSSMAPVRLSATVVAVVSFVGLLL